MSKKSAQDRAEALQDRNFQEWLKLNIPDPGLQALALKEFVTNGKLIPELEQAIKQDPSAFEKIVENTRLKESRMRSLRSLEDLGSGEETFEDKAALQSALIQSGAKARGKQAAIVSDFAQRGQGGSGLELAARMDQAQADADAAGRDALSIERDRRGRALRAIESAGSLAGEMSDDDYRMQSDKARAADEISRFNARNLQDVLSRNTQAKNQAAKFNLEREQEVSDKNIALRNYEQEHNKNLIQQRFDNEVKVAAGKGGQYAAAAAQANKAGDSAAQFWGNLAGNIPKVATAFSRNSDDDSADEEEEDE
jgi:hypothetical protein